MRLEIKVGAISNAHQFVPLPFIVFALREEAILNVDRAFCVMREFFLWLLVKPQVRLRDADILKPLIARVNPLLMCRFVFAWFDEIFHLHLLELARAKDEIARRYFVAKRLAHLRDAERQLA